MEDITEVIQSITRFNGLDYFLLIILAFLVIRGIIKGGAVVVLNSLGFALGLWLGMRYYLLCGEIISRIVPSLKHTGIIAFIAIFFLTWFSIGAAGHWIAAFLRKTGLGLFDRILGAFVGLILALVIQALVVAALTLLLPKGHPLIGESVLARYSLQGVALIYSSLPEGVKKELENRRDVLRSYREGHGEKFNRSSASGKRSKI